MSCLRLFVAFIHRYQCDSANNNKSGELSNVG